MSTVSTKPSSQSVELKTKVELINIKKIRRDGGTQPRARLDEETISTYVHSLRDGAQFPPVTLFYDGENYWLADGFHRTKAHEEIEQKQIAAEIINGTRREAVLYSVGVNATHGLRRSIADKRRVVETLLKDPEWRQWSDREIASRCKVSHPYVGRIRHELFGNQSAEDLTDSSNASSGVESFRLADRGGKIYTINTGNIGSKSSDQRPNQQSTQRKRRHKDTNASPKPIIVRAKKVRKGEVWQFGKRHRLFCGSPSSHKFQELLPDEIALLLLFSSTPDEWLPSLPNQATSILAFHTPYHEDMHLEALRNLVSNSISSTTDGGDTVVLLNLPDPSLFILLEEMDCHSVCAEPDPETCTQAMSAWTITKQAATKL